MAQETGPSEDDVTTSLFLSLVQLLSDQAWIALGRRVDPATQKQESNLDQARLFIDLLGMLDKRTQGNRTKPEDAFLRQSLTSLRLTFLDDLKTAGRKTSEEPSGGEAPAAGGEAAAGDPPGEGAAKGKPRPEPPKGGDGGPKVVDRRSSKADT